MRSTVAAAASALMLAAGACHAQNYPSSPISLVIPLTPGDATDIAARAMGDELAKRLKVAVVPVTRPGAGAALGTDSVVKAPKDGYTILITINAALTFRRVLDPRHNTCLRRLEQALAALGQRLVVHAEAV